MNIFEEIKHRRTTMLLKLMVCLGLFKLIEANSNVEINPAAAREPKVSQRGMMSSEPTYYDEELFEDDGAKANGYYTTSKGQNTGQLSYEYPNGILGQNGHQSSVRNPQNGNSNVQFQHRNAQIQQSNRPQNNGRPSFHYDNQKGQASPFWGQGMGNLNSDGNQGMRGSTYSKEGNYYTNGMNDGSGFNSRQFGKNVPGFGQLPINYGPIPAGGNLGAGQVSGLNSYSGQIPPNAYPASEQISLNSYPASGQIPNAFSGSQPTSFNAYTDMSQPPVNTYLGSGQTPVNAYLGTGQTPFNVNSGALHAPSNGNTGLGQTSFNVNSGLGQPSLNAYSGLGQPSLNAYSGLGQSPMNTYSGLGQPSLNAYLGLGQSPMNTYSGLGQPSLNAYPGLGQSPMNAYSGLGQPSLNAYSGLEQSPMNAYSGLGQPPLNTYSNFEKVPSNGYLTPGQASLNAYTGSGQMNSNMYPNSGSMAYNGFKDGGKLMEFNEKNKPSNAQFLLNGKPIPGISLSGSGAASSLDPYNRNQYYGNVPNVSPNSPNSLLNPMASNAFFKNGNGLYTQDNLRAQTFVNPLGYVGMAPSQFPAYYPQNYRISTLPNKDDLLYPLSLQLQNDQNTREPFVAKTTLKVNLKPKDEQEEVQVVKTITKKNKPKEPHPQDVKAIVNDDLTQSNQNKPS